MHAKLFTCPLPNTHGQLFDTPSKPTSSQPDTTSIPSFRLNSNRSLAWCGTTRGDASPNQDTLILRQSLETLDVTRQRIVEVLNKVDPMRKATHRHRTACGGTLSGPLQQLSHVQWEQITDASPVDNNPLVACMSSEAAREALTSFGAGASADMVQALATWIASHVRVRRATRAPNHWCWSTTIVCWLIARHNGREQGLSARSLATRFGMNAAGMRQRPIAFGNVKAQRANTPSTWARCPQVHRASASMRVWSRTPTQESPKSQLRILIGWRRPYGRKPAKRSREAKRTELTLRPPAWTCK